MNAPTAQARRTAARGLAEVVDSKLFRALCEPARIDILRQLTLLGRVDIGTLADRLPQDRSVISRHLGLLRDAGIVRREKRGRKTSSPPMFFKITILIAFIVLKFRPGKRRQFNVVDTSGKCFTALPDKITRCGTQDKKSPRTPVLVY